MLSAAELRRDLPAGKIARKLLRQETLADT